MPALKTILTGSCLLPVLSGTFLTLLSSISKRDNRQNGLLFHSIDSNPGLNMSRYSPDRFETLLNLFSERNIKITTVKDSPSIKKDRTGILTFDDGLESIYINALPILEKFGYKATIFCVAGYGGKKADWDVYRGNAHLTEKMIFELSSLGHEIGSHTLTHACLPFLKDADLLYELKKSKDILEDITGQEVTSISFPHGSWNARVWRTAQEAGYRKGTVYRGHSNIMENLFPVYGVYRFDRPADLLKRIIAPKFSISLTTAILMSQFAKGTQIWKFRKNYTLFP